jgi:hypothetical protein
MRDRGEPGRAKGNGKQYILTHPEASCGAIAVQVYYSTSISYYQETYIKQQLFAKLDH